METKVLKLLDTMIADAFENCAMEQPEVANTVVMMISAVVNNFLEDESNGEN